MSVLTSEGNTLKMGVENTGFLVDRLGEDCAPLQYLRELTQNSIEAILKLPNNEKGEIVWDIDDVTRTLNGKRYLSIIDTGVGMAASEQLKYINMLSSSASIQAMDRNYGIGAKIAGVTRNHRGLIYLSWRDKKGSMLHLWRDQESNQYGLRQHDLGGGRYDHVVAVSDDVKPKLVKEHGTKVVLLGNDDEVETILPPPGVRAPNKWIRRYLNTRYYELPERVTIKVREGWDLPQTDQNYTLREVYGQKRFLEDHSVAKGMVELTGAKVHWWILEDKKELTQNFSHFAASGHIAALYQSELYEFTEQRAGAARLQQFGVVFGYQRVVLYLEPIGGDGVTIASNTARTLLLYNKEPLPWAEWAAEFRQQMPPEIDKLMAEVASGSSSENHKDSILDRIKRIKELFSITRYRKATNGNVSVDDFSTPGGSAGEGENKKAGDRKPGGSGGRAGDVYALFIKDEGENAEPVIVEQMPEVKWVSQADGTRASGLLEDRAAGFIPEKNLLQINADFRVFTDMIERYVKMFGDQPGISTVVTDVTHEWFEQTLVETIMGVMAIKDSSPLWDVETTRAAWSEEALTAAIMPRYHVDLAIKRGLSSKLGSLKDKAELEAILA